MKKYKYLNYAPVPVHLKQNTYDLVDDKEFCHADDRIPLLIATQFGIFPSGGSYQGKKNYGQLVGLEYQHVGFIGRAYLSQNECKGIIEFYLDANTLRKIREKVVKIDLTLWSTNYSSLKLNKMEHIYIRREQDKIRIEAYKKGFEVETLESLVKSYNQQVKCGIVGVREQALYLMALRQEFKERLKESPVYLLDHVLGLIGPIAVVNGNIRIIK